MNDDRGNLDLLGVFHWVLAAVTALFSLMPVMHLVIGISMLTGGFGPPPSSHEEFPFQAMGLFFVVFASLFILCGLTLAVCLALAGRFLKRHTHYTFCLVTAAVACAFIPLGTVLGVFTIIVLRKDSVQTLFAAPPVSAPVP